MSSFRNALLAAVVMTVGAAGAAQAALTVSGSVGGAPTGVTLDNLEWLSLGTAGGLSPQSGITVNFTPNAQAVQGSAAGLYAAPFLSGGNGTGFGRGLTETGDNFFIAGSIIPKNNAARIPVIWRP